MSDRRLTPFSGRVAHESLRGQIEAPAFTAGEAASLIVPVADLCPEPGALRDRQLLFGAALTVIDRAGEAVFVQAVADGYCGWVAAAAVGPACEASHWVAAPATHLYREASIKRGEVARLSLGARVAVLAETGGFARTAEGYIPAQHLAPLAAPAPDPVALAESLLGTPYLWGGNSRDGIDCSGLVQAAFLACGLPLPGDSDLQAQCGTPLSEGEALRRNDLIFWNGHVALALSDQVMIHATAARMAVVEENTASAIARILAAGDGPVTGRRRISRSA